MLTTMTRVAIGSDHAGFAAKNALAEHLCAAGYTVHDLGTFSEESVDYPDIALMVARCVASGRMTLAYFCAAVALVSPSLLTRSPGYALLTAVHLQWQVLHGSTTMRTFSAWVPACTLSQSFWLSQTPSCKPHSKADATNAVSKKFTP